MGLLGAGYILDAHARVLRRMPQLELRAVADLSLARAQAAALRHGIARVHGSLSAMLEDGIDVLHVLTPPAHHGAAIAQALAAGVQVLSEKPVVLDSVQLQRLLEQADTRGLTLAVNHNFLFSRAYSRLRQDVRKGFFGPLNRLEVLWQLPLGQFQNMATAGWLAAAPGNVMHEVGPHVLAMAVDLLGPMRVDQVRVSDALAAPGGGLVYRSWEVSAVASGVTVSLRIVVRPAAPERSIRVFGLAANGVCHFDRERYTRSEIRHLNPLLDDALDGLDQGLRTLGQQLASLGAGVRGTLQGSASMNTYAATFQASLAAFYDGLRGARDGRFAPELTREVVRLCEDVVARLPLPAADQTRDLRAARPGEPFKAGLPCDLVTGATGFIGRVLVAQLREAGRSVRIVTRQREAARLALAGLDVEICEGSLTDPAFLEGALAGVDTVYHLSRGEGKRWQDYLSSDVTPTECLGRAAAQARVRRFVYTGTIDSYYSGDPGQSIRGDTPLDPRIARRNHYARAKAAGEASLQALHRQGKLPLVIVRPGIVIGRGSSPAHWGVGMFLGPASVGYWGDGSHPLPFVLVGDVARALCLAGQAEGIEGRSLLVTDAPLLSGRDYVAALEKAMATSIRQRNLPAWRSFIADVMKESLKHLVRHPNRRLPSYRDWKSRQHVARYDSTETCMLLGWRPAGTAQLLIQEGIEAPVKEFFR